MTRKLKLSASPSALNLLSIRPASVTLSPLPPLPVPRRRPPHWITTARRWHSPTHSCSCQGPIRKTTAKITGTSSCPASQQPPLYPSLRHSHILSHQDLILLFLLDPLPFPVLHDPLGHYVLVLNHLHPLVSLGVKELQTQELVSPEAEAHHLVGIDPDHPNVIDRQSTRSTGVLHRRIKDEVLHLELVHLWQFEDLPFEDHHLLVQGLDHLRGRNLENNQRVVY